MPKLPGRRTNLNRNVSNSIDHRNAFSSSQLQNDAVTWNNMYIYDTCKSAAWFMPPFGIIPVATKRQKLKNIKDDKCPKDMSKNTSNYYQHHDHRSSVPFFHQPANTWSIIDLLTRGPQKSPPTKGFSAPRHPRSGLVTVLGPWGNLEDLSCAPCSWKPLLSR